MQGGPLCKAAYLTTHRTSPKMDGMSALRKPALVSEEEYFAITDASELRQEYVNGQVCAMADPSDAHETISGNVFGPLHQHLRKHPCRVFSGNKRVRVAFLNRAFHYYPDVMVICDPKNGDSRFKENPVLVIEVLSPSTENTDIREKMFAYLNTESVKHYVIIAQEKKEIIVYRRVPPPDGWEVETLTEDADILRVPDLGFSMTLADVYEKVEFAS